MHLASGLFDPVHQDPITGRLQVGIVADMDDRNEEAEFARHLAAHGAQPAQQSAVVLLADETDQPVSDLNFQRLDQFDDADIDLAGFGRCRCRRRLTPGFARPLASEPPATGAEQRRKHQKRQMRHARNNPEQSDDPGGEPPRLRERRELAYDLVADIVPGRNPADDHAGRRGNHQCRYLRDEAVADRQQGVGLTGFGKAEAVLPYAR